MLGRNHRVNEDQQRDVAIRMGVQSGGSRYKGLNGFWGQLSVVWSRQDPRDSPPRPVTLFVQTSDEVVFS